MTAAVAYWLVILGMLLVYIELLRPQAILPGVCGVAMLCLGAHGLWRHALRPEGLALCAAAAAMITAEAVWELKWAGGAAGAVGLIAGSMLLCSASLPLPLTVSGGLIVGIASTVLARTGRRARRNKAVAP